VQLNVYYISATSLTLGGAPINDSFVASNVPTLYSYTGTPVCFYDFTVTVVSAGVTSLDSVYYYAGTCGDSFTPTSNCAGNTCTYTTAFICPQQGVNTPFFYLLNNAIVEYSYSLSAAPTPVPTLNATNGPLTVSTNSYYTFKLTSAQSISVTASSTSSLNGLVLTLYSTTCAQTSTDCTDSNTCTVSVYDPTQIATGNWYLEVGASSSFTINITLSLGAQNCKSITVTGNDICGTVLGGTSNTILQINDPGYNLAQAEILVGTIYNAFAVLPNINANCLSSVLNYSCNGYFQFCDSNGFPAYSSADKCTLCQQFYNTCSTSGACLQNVCSAFCTTNTGTTTGTKTNTETTNGNNNTDGNNGSSSSVLEPFWFHFLKLF